MFLGLHDAGDKHSATNRSVERIILHPSFQPDSYDNDIALLRLSQGAELNELIQPVCLPQVQPQVRTGGSDGLVGLVVGNWAPCSWYWCRILSSRAGELLQVVGTRPLSHLCCLFQDVSRSPGPNSLGVVAGWGISSLNASSPSSPPTLSSDPGMTSDLLQYVKLPVVSQDECQSSYASRSVRYNITDNMFCAGFFEGGQDTCLGDSGGAFVMEERTSRRWAVFGLVSWGGPGHCGSQGLYGVYTRVAPYVEWILEQLHTAPW